MLIPDGYKKNELIVKKSRFIAEVHILTAETSAIAQMQVRGIIKETRGSYVGASHICHAYIWGDAGTIAGCSDDGEPTGTAGRPMLEIVKGSNITNILVTVTRYFGGTLLGTGGLVKAYGDSVKSVLSLLQPVKLVRFVRFSFSTTYDTFGAIKRLMESHQVEIEKEDFTESILVTAKISESAYSAFADSLSELSAGRVLSVIQKT